MTFPDFSKGGGDVSKKQEAGDSFTTHVTSTDDHPRRQRTMSSASSSTPFPAMVSSAPSVMPLSSMARVATNPGNVAYVACATSVQEEIAQFSWRLNDFAQLRFLASCKALNTPENCLESPPYIDRLGASWWLRIYPFDSIAESGRSESDKGEVTGDGNVGVFLHTTRPSQETVCFSMHIAAVDAKGNEFPETVARKPLHRFEKSSGERNFGFFDFLSGDKEFLSFLVDGSALLLQCELRIFGATHTSASSASPVRDLAPLSGGLHRESYVRSFGPTLKQPSLHHQYLPNTSVLPAVANSSPSIRPFHGSSAYIPSGPSGVSASIANSVDPRNTVDNGPVILGSGYLAKSGSSYVRAGTPTNQNSHFQRQFGQPGNGTVVGRMSVPPAVIPGPNPRVASNTRETFSVSRSPLAAS